MLANELITDVPQLSFNDNIKKIKDYYLEFCLCDLPVVKNNKLIGIVTSESVNAYQNNSKKISSFSQDLKFYFVYENQHLLDVLFFFGEHHTTLLPVIDNHSNYIGSVTLRDFIIKLSELYTFNETGGVITLEIDSRDFVLSEIARIVESNDAKILSLISRFNQDHSKIFVTIKLNHLDLKHINATFERFGYNTTIYHREPDSDDLIKERYEMLMKYLNI